MVKNNEDIKEVDHIFKIVICGNYKCGKTSFIDRFIADTYIDERPKTIETPQFRNKILHFDDYEIKITLSDAFGSYERFRTPGVSPYRRAHGIILAYDITDRDSFGDCKKWFEDAIYYSNKYDPPIFHLVGLKLDLVEFDQNLRKVKYEEAKEIADKFNITFNEVSSKYNIGVQELILNLTKQILNKYIQKPVHNNNNNNKVTFIATDNYKSKKCNIQ